MVRYERFNFAASVLDSREDERLLAKAIEEIPKDPKFPHLKYSNAIETAMDLVTRAHLDRPPARWTVRQLLEQVVSLAVGYFSGDWRRRGPVFSGEPATPERVREKARWFGELRLGLLAALLLGDEAGGRRLCEYADFDLPLADESPARQMWVVWLAKHLSGAPVDEVHAAHAKVTSSRGVNAVKPLVAALDGLIAGEANGFCAGLLEHMKAFRAGLWKDFHYRGAEFVSVEGSILWHLARRRGMEPPDLASHVTRRPKFKVKRPGVTAPVLETTLLDYVLFPEGVAG